ncbi:MAG: amino acid permease [Myxococcaceae bacterium]
MTAPPAGGSDNLERFGYAQQLKRGMGGFQSFALSFSVISILTGAVTLYGYGFKWGGPLVMGLGWPVVAFFTFAIALSMAELASAFPTAGALYHWSALLGGKGAGFATAWLNLVGQVAISASIDYGLAEFVVALAKLEGGRPMTLLVFAAVLTSHALLNHFGVRVLTVLNTLSAWYHLLGVAVLVGALVWRAPMRPLAELLQPYSLENEGLRYGFMVALLQAAWTFTGYDASAHVSEETVDAPRAAPRGILLAVGVSAVAGWAMLAAVTLAVPDYDLAAAADNTFIYVLHGALGGVGDALVWMAVGAMYFCGLASVTSNSRMLWAFARDEGVPFSQLLGKVDARFKTPHVAIWVSVAAALALGAWADALSVMTALSTAALYISYVLPVWFGLRARASGRWKERGPFHLGRWSSLVNVVALLWVAAVVVLMALPPNESAGIALGVTVVLLVVAWFAGVRRVFGGPKVTLEQLGAR